MLNFLTIVSILLLCAFVLFMILLGFFALFMILLLYLN